MDLIINAITKPFKGIYAFLHKCLEFFKDDKNQVSSKRVCMAIMLAFTSFVMVNQMYFKALSVEIYQITMKSLEAVDIALIASVASEKFTNIKETLANVKEKVLKVIKK